MKYFIGAGAIHMPEQAWSTVMEREERAGEKDLPALMVRYQQGDPGVAVEALIRWVSPCLMRFLATPGMSKKRRRRPFSGMLDSDRQGPAYLPSCRAASAVLLPLRVIPGWMHTAGGADGNREKFWSLSRPNRPRQRCRLYRKSGTGSTGCCRSCRQASAK